MRFGIVSLKDTSASLRKLTIRWCLTQTIEWSGTLTDVQTKEEMHHESECFNFSPLTQGYEVLFIVLQDFTAIRWTTKAQFLGHI